MDISQLFADEGAISPVIGVVLMVAITVILATTVGTFVLGVGDQRQLTAPQVNLIFEYHQDEDGSNDVLTVHHKGGDALVSDTVSFTVTGATDTADADDAKLQTDATWDGVGGTYPVISGSSVDLDVTDFDEVDNDGGATGLNQLDLSRATVHFVWTSSGGGSTATLGKWAGPNA